MLDILDKVFGYLGSSLLIVSMIPQLYKTYHSKSASDISALFLGIQLFTAGTLLTYSIIIYQIPMIYGNCGILLELIILSYMKWRWRNRVKDTPHNLIEMNTRFQGQSDNLHKILERSNSFIRKRIPLNEKLDIEYGRTSREIDTDSNKSEEEDQGLVMTSSYSSNDNIEVFIETSL